MTRVVLFHAFSKDLKWTAACACTGGHPDLAQWQESAWDHLLAPPCLDRRRIAPCAPTLCQAQAFSRLNNKKQPKPPPPPPPPKVLDANATAADGNATARAGANGTDSAGGQQQDKEAHDELRR
jgi:hypothetical protein